MSRKIAISFTEGRVVRDIFYNGLHAHLLQRGLKLEFFTPAARVQAFVDKWKQPGLEFFQLNPYQLNKNEYRAQRFRQHIIIKLPIVLPLWMEIENSLFMRSGSSILKQFTENKPDLVVITNPMHSFEFPVYYAAKSLGIKTLGIIRSWDNLYKGLRIRPDDLAVWNPINQAEAIKLMKYKPENVHIVGSSQFDPYFDPKGVQDRATFAHSFGLEPSRPIITLATLGPFQHQYDETYLMDWLVDAIRNGKIPSNSQLVCRLHPASRLEQFLKYKKLDFVRLSYTTGYIPSLAWTMSTEDVWFAGNLLRHSNVVISPGSTITIETAIFDTPTIVPIFHTYQPELGKLQFDQHLSTHFGRLKELNLVPIIDDETKLAEAINTALNQPQWYAKQRSQLVNDYVRFTDGKTSLRIADLIFRLVKTNQINLA